ncbi:hypothetical protein [Phocaeicola dorei]|uniref:hypothetical protein n=1 Tax=Phocaeicola dorei TaxID=357276 RepID=UPI00374E0344
MPKRLTFPSNLSATPQTPCLSAFRLKDMHCEMFQPENILQKNDSLVSTQFRAYPFERALFSALNRVLLKN